MFGGASVAPYFLHATRAISGDVYWLYAGTTAVYAYELIGTAAGTHTDITRASGPYTASAVYDWQGGTLNGVPIINNGVDTPQMWLPVSQTQVLQPLTAWPASTTAKIIRSYKNFLVALDVTKSGVRDASLVKWSHTASAGTVPSSWDETNPALDAGEYSLSDTPGVLVDCLPLRDLNIIYKTDSIWSMQAVPGAGIFRFAKLFGNVGMLAKNCAVEYQTGKHIVLAKDDLFVHDGQTLTSIGYGKLNSWIFDNVNPDYVSRSFLALDAENKDVWICFPGAGQTLPTVALVWNWVNGTFGQRELPNVASISSGLIGSLAQDAWNVDATTWQADGEWGQVDLTSARARLFMASPLDSKLFAVLPSSENFAGVTQNVELTRTGLGVPFRTGEAPDISSMKFCTNVWPRLVGQVGTVVQVEFGTQMTADASPTWGAAQNFIIGTTKKLDVRATGRLFAIRFTSSGIGAWELQGYDLAVQFVGGF